MPPKRKSDTEQSHSAKVADTDSRRRNALMEEAMRPHMKTIVEFLELPGYAKKHIHVFQGAPLEPGMYRNTKEGLEHLSSVHPLFAKMARPHIEVARDEIEVIREMTMELLVEIPNEITPICDCISTIVDSHGVCQKPDEHKIFITQVNVRKLKHAIFNPVTGEERNAAYETFNALYKGLIHKKPVKRMHSFYLGILMMHLLHQLNYPKNWNKWAWMISGFIESSDLCSSQDSIGIVFALDAWYTAGMTSALEILSSFVERGDLLTLSKIKRYEGPMSGYYFIPEEWSHMPSPLYKYLGISQVHYDRNSNRYWVDITEAEYVRLEASMLKPEYWKSEDVVRIFNRDAHSYILARIYEHIVPPPSTKIISLRPRSDSPIYSPESDGRPPHGMSHYDLLHRPVPRIVAEAPRNNRWNRYDEAFLPPEDDMERLPTLMDDLMKE